MSKNGYKIRNQYNLHFLTLTVVGWVDLFTRKECKDIVIDSLNFCQKNKGLIITAYCIMDSHVHIVARADPDSKGLSSIMRDGKRHMATKILDWVFKGGRESRKEWLKLVFAYHAKYNRRNSNFQVWQQGNQPKECLHPKFTWQKIGYVHGNPVVSGIVNRAEHYVYSSACTYAQHQPGLIDVEIYDGDVGMGYIMT